MDSKYKILYIEDQGALSRALTRAFEKEGIEFLSEKDGEAGLSTALREHPDLLLLDILMPNMDGITMLRELRKDPWGKDAKVLILSNLSDAQKEREANELGVVGYIVKSDINASKIIDRARMILES